MTETRYHSSAPGVGDLLAGRSRGRHMERTGVKVRRNSRDVSDPICSRYSLPHDDAEDAPFLQAAERYNLEHKEDGKYVGPLRGRGMDVLRWLRRESRGRGGRFFPSHAQIAAALKIGLRTIRRIMKALYLAGFLEWQRQSVEVEGDDGRIRREQTANLYRFNIPADLAGLVTRLVAARNGGNARPLRSLRVVGEVELRSRPDLWQESLTGRLAGPLSALAALVDRATKGAKLALS